MEVIKFGRSAKLRIGAQVRRAMMVMMVGSAAGWTMPAAAAVDDLARFDSTPSIDLDAPVGDPDTKNTVGGVTLDPKLGRSFLSDQTAEPNNPKIVVGRYSKARGLVVGYQSMRGKRIMFSAAFPPTGGLYAQAWSFDEASKKFVPVFRKSNLARETGEKVRDISVGGVDIMSLVKGQIGKRKNEDQAENLAKLLEFVDSDVGDAFFEAVPALYATLGTLESAEPEIAKLKMPFGGVAMMVQIGTKRVTGFAHAEKVMGAAAFVALTDACAGKRDCRYRGNAFIVRKSGLFDVVSKH